MCQGKSNICRFFPFLWTFLFRITALLLTPPRSLLKWKFLNLTLKQCLKFWKHFEFQQSGLVSCFGKDFTGPSSYYKVQHLVTWRLRARQALRGSRKRYASNHHGGGGSKSWTMLAVSELEEVLSILDRFHLPRRELESLGGLKDEDNGRTKAKLANLRQKRLHLKHSWSWWEEESTCSPGESLRGGASLLKGHLYSKEVVKKDDMFCLALA